MRMLTLEMQTVLVALLAFAGGQSSQSPARVGDCSPNPAVSQELRPADQQAASEQPPPKPIRIKSLRFISDQPLPALSKQIASHLKASAAIQDGPDWPVELQDQAREAWQEHGYIAAQLDFPDVDVLHDNEHEQVVRVKIKIDPAKRYRTGDITFSNNIQFDAFQLRALFPLRKGEVFDPHKISEGIEAARSAYGERGFIKFAFEPSVHIDEARNLVSLEINIEEADQFRVGKFRILGVEPEIAQKLIEKSGLAPGGIFNSNWAKVFFERNQALLPSSVGSDATTERHIDQKTAIVDLTVDFRRCPGEK